MLIDAHTDLSGSGPQAIFFDLDDTIIAFTEGAEPTWRAIAERFSGPMSGITADVLLVALNNSRSFFWADPDRHREGRMNLVAARRRITASALSSLDLHDEALAVEMADSFISLREQTIRLFPGAIDTLARLQRHGIRLALITNGTAEGQRAKISRFDLAQYFELILIEGEFGIGKPDKRVFLEALKRMEVVAQDTWMVGDNLEWDIVVPQTLGLMAVWVDFAGVGLPEDSEIRPDHIVGSITELLVA